MRTCTCTTPSVYNSLSNEAPFDASLFVEVRNRFGIDQINAMNESIINLANTKNQPQPYTFNLITFIAKELIGP